MMSDVEDHGDEEENRSRCLDEYDEEYEIGEEENGDSEESESEGENGDEGVEGGSEGFTIDEVPNQMKRRELKALRLQFHIPSSIGMRLPKRDEKPSQPPKGEVLIHPEFFHCGLRLPLHPFLQRFTYESGLTLMQLNPEVIRVAIAMYILWKENDLGEPSFRQFKNQVDLKTYPKSIGWWYQSTYPNNGALINGKAHIGSWKEKFFFASGDWEFGRVDAPSQDRIKTHFQSRERFTRPERPPDISEKELEEIAFIRANIKEVDRSKQTLLSVKNLEKYNFIPPKTKGMDVGKKKTNIVSRKNNEALLRALERRGAGPSNVHRSIGDNLASTAPMHIVPSPPEVVVIEESTSENQRIGSGPEVPSPKRARVHDGAHPLRDHVPIIVPSRLANFLQASSLAIREPEKSRLEKVSQRKMAENSFISTIEAALLQHETHQELLNDIDNKKLTIIDLQKKQIEDQGAFEAEKKKIQDALTQAQVELQEKVKEVGELKKQVVELSSTVGDYARHVESAEIKGFNRCLKCMEKVYKDSLNLSLMYDAIKNNELSDDSGPEEEEEAQVHVDEGNAPPGGVDNTQAPNNGASL